MIVDFHETEEQTLIQASVQSLLDKQLPLERLREPDSHKGVAEQASWEDLSGLGLFGLGLAESEGGIGYSLIEETMTARAMGGNLVSPGVIAQMIAVHITEDMELRAQLMAGHAKAAFLNVIDGNSAHLLDGDSATHLVVVNQGLALEPRGSFTAGTGIDGIDETVAMEKMSGQFPAPPRSSVSDRLSLLLAAYLSGIAQAARDMAVEYAQTREQFGHVIGAFQALKHQCADMHVRAEAAYAQCLYSATVFAVEDPATASVETACARLLARDAALANAKNNIQLHGGMGFTAECEAHLYLKRAHLLSMLGSGLRSERLRILQQAT